VKNIFDIGIIKDLENLLKNYNMSDDAKSVLNHIKKLCYEFV